MSIGCGHQRRAVRVLHGIGGVKPTLKAVNKPLHHSIVHGLDKPGSSATVSENRVGRLVKKFKRTIFAELAVSPSLAPHLASYRTISHTHS